VTSQGYVDTACHLAGRSDVTVATYGDMVRVPGTETSLELMRSQGAEVTVVYSARDALKLAASQPDRTVAFLAVGFETTAPATAATLLEADTMGVENFCILPGHKLVLPAMKLLLEGGEVPIDGFLCPGHVSVVLGSNAYEPIVQDYRKPCVVAGFEPENMLEGILHLVRQATAKQARLENVYSVAVRPEGNTVAMEMIDRVFAPGPAVWRAMGEIPESGLELRPDFRRYDAREMLGVEFGPDRCPEGCRCGEVIQGKIVPPACDQFATGCTPVHPIGPCMVSSEGTCAAWYKYRGSAAGEGNT
jgi:hydrogenase expression/formation protein HypD